VSRPFTHLAVLLVAITVSVYAMFAATSPSISAGGLATAADSAAIPQARPQPPPGTLIDGRNTSAASASSSANGPADPLNLQIRLAGRDAVEPVEGGAGVTSSQAAPPPTTTPATNDCVPASSGLFCVYTVRAGDTLSAIAARFGIRSSGELSPAEILVESNKPAVVESDEITTGLKLRIPVQNGIIHTVFQAETLSEVAARYGVKASDIQSVAGNNIPADGTLRAGQELVIPNPQQVATIAPPLVATAPPPASTPAQDTAIADAVAEDESDESGAASVDVAADEEAVAEDAAIASEPEGAATSVEEPVTGEEAPVAEEAAVDEGAADEAVPEETVAEETPTPEPTATSTPRPPRPTPTPRPSATATPHPAGTAPSRAGFIWPASGPISSYFGAGHPLGIDIDFYSNPNQAVVAVADGTVTFAGGDPCCSYGYYVIVDHGNGFVTLYAHFSSIAVSQGQKVAQGQVLGYGGRTGYATGNHLHFEVHLNGAIVNPLNYLP
jgi:murein DD-endopeptidase MepM/ murein hydrolase activator NlpD